MLPPFFCICEDAQQHPSAQELLRSLLVETDDALLVVPSRTWSPAAVLTLWWTLLALAFLGRVPRRDPSKR